MWLSGWQRIGLVATVVLTIVYWSYVGNIYYQHYENIQVGTTQIAWGGFIVTYVIGILIFWIGGALLLLLYRWIARGF